MTTESTTRRRWFQFRLRTLLILVAVLAVPLAWLAHERGKVREQNAWLESLAKRGMPFECEDGPADQSTWLRTLLGDDLPGDVILLNVNVDCANTDLMHLAGLTRLQTLSLSGDQVKDTGLVHLADLTHLQELNLSFTKVTDAGLVHLAGLTNLKELHLNNTKVTDVGLAQLSYLTNLEYLLLRNTQVTDAGLVHLAGLKKLEFLDLENTRVTDVGRQKLRQSLPKIDIRPNP